MTGEKICVLCNQDVSGKPRTKDRQGRYACRACLDKRAAAMPATEIAVPPEHSPKRSAPSNRGTPSDDDNLMAALVADATKDQGDPCPQCGVVMQKNGAICTRCGFSIATGKAVRTRVIAAEKEKKVRSGPAFEMTPGKAFFAVVALTAVLVGVSFVSPIAMVFALLVAGVGGVAAAIGTIIYGIKDGHLVWVIATFLIPIAGLYFIFFKLERPMIRALYGAVIVANLIIFAGMLANPEGADQLGDERIERVRQTTSRDVAPSQESK